MFILHRLIPNWNGSLSKEYHIMLMVANLMQNEDGSKDDGGLNEDGSKDDGLIAFRY